MVGLPHPLFLHGSTEKAKLISGKSIFFTKIKSWNQYNSFLKLE